MKLDFDYDTSTGGCQCSMPEQTATYRGYTIRAVYDWDARNPFEEFDSEPPILADTDGRLVSYGLDASLPDLSREEIKANAHEIAMALGSTTLLRGVRDFFPHNDGVDAVNDALGEKFVGEYKRTQLEMIEQAWRWKGCETFSGARNGYVQRAWCTVLAVATPEWVEKVGAPKESLEDQLKAAADLYAAWAFGDCYEWIVEDEDGEEVASCCGYYGSDHEESGLAEAAREAIDHEIEKRRRARIDRVKTWIRNRVPLGHRCRQMADGVFA
jgi:hypothetical protein